MTSDLVASPPAVRGAEGRLVADRPGDVDQRIELARLLQVAAAIEHSLMVQYLYAAYSADVVIASNQFPDAAAWQQQLLTVAREEMGHLMTVQNALRLIGAEPNWKREDIPWDGPYYPFTMEFEPFTFIAIEKYVYAEMDPSIDQVPPPGRKVSPQRKQWEALRKKIDADVMKATGGKANHVGKLFRDLLVRLRDPTLTDEQWFDPATYPQQASWDAWGKGYRPHPLDADLDDARQPPNVIVAQMGTRTEAIDGLTQIAGQGRPPTCAIRGRGPRPISTGSWPSTTASCRSPHRWAHSSRTSRPTRPPGSSRSTARSPTTRARRRSSGSTSRIRHRARLLN